MDGRVQIPVNEWMREYLDVDYVDTITGPGVDLILSKGQFGEVNSIRERVMISIEAHGSGTVAVVGHYDCAGNPVSKEEHIKHINDSVDKIASWGISVRILGLWVDENWRIEIIRDERKSTSDI